MTFTFDNQYASLGDGFYTALEPLPLPDPKVVLYNHDELKNSGFSSLSKGALLNFFSGNSIPEGAAPLAMKYAGHQFGYYNPDLGDGRGLLMGQFRSEAGQLLDLHLKGSGKTPYSRMGDGRAVLRSSIREFLASEALHHLGIPTTRALAITTSNEPVRRETKENATMLMRLSDSHIRFGSFEHFYYTEQFGKLTHLADYVIEHHFKEARDAENPYDALSILVAKKTATLIAKWQAFGFAHGVLNTDNMSITGHTFDYGPYGFMENYDPHYICNHSDDQGRYAFNRQPAIGHWNLQALAQALSPLLSDKAPSKMLETYQTTFLDHYHQLMSEKLGLSQLKPNDKSIYQDLLDLMEGYQVDYSLFFRHLSQYEDGAPPSNLAILKSCADEFEPWFKRYNDHLKGASLDNDKRAKEMCALNPKYILRNYLAQRAIQASEQGDHSELNQLYQVLKTPYEERPQYNGYAKEAPDWGKNMQISCSS